MTDFSGLAHSNVVIAWLEVNKQQQLLWLLLRRTQSLSQVVQNLLADKLFGNIRFRGGFPYFNAKRFTQIAELDQKLEQFDYCTHIFNTFPPSLFQTGNLLFAVILHCLSKFYFLNNFYFLQ